MLQKSKLTAKYKAVGNRYFLAIAPVLLIVGLFIFLLLNVSLKSIWYNYAGIAIAIGVGLIFSKSFIQVKKELKKGEMHQYSGILNHKTTLGKTKLSGGGLSKGGKRTRTKTYILTVNDEKFRVKAKHYKKVSIDDNVKVVYLPQSKFILDVIKNA